jgi:hypothetical protein
MVAAGSREDELPFYLSAVSARDGRLKKGYHHGAGGVMVRANKLFSYVDVLNEWH